MTGTDLRWMDLYFFQKKEAMAAANSTMATSTREMRKSSAWCDLDPPFSAAVLESCASVCWGDSTKRETQNQLGKARTIQNILSVSIPRR